MMRIDLCGGIGVGKTTIAALISEREDLVLVREDYRSVPFWALSCVNPSLYSLERNLSFALSHTDAIISQSSSGKVICDFALIQDMFYARLGPSADIPILKSVHNVLEAKIGAPDLVIYASCKASTQIQRIEERGRTEESSIDINYLNLLNNSIRLGVDEVKARGTKVIEINTEEHDTRFDYSFYNEIRYKLLSMLRP